MGHTIASPSFYHIKFFFQCLDKAKNKEINMSPAAPIPFEGKPENAQSVEAMMQSASEKMNISKEDRELIIRMAKIQQYLMTSREQIANASRIIKSNLHNMRTHCAIMSLTQKSFDEIKDMLDWHADRATCLENSAGALFRSLAVMLKSVGNYADAYKSLPQWNIDQDAMYGQALDATLYRTVFDKMTPACFIHEFGTISQLCDILKNISTPENGFRSIDTLQTCAKQFNTLGQTTAFSEEEAQRHVTAFDFALVCKMVVDGYCTVAETVFPNILNVIHEIYMTHLAAIQYLKEKPSDIGVVGKLKATREAWAAAIENFHPIVINYTLLAIQAYVFSVEMNWVTEATQEEEVSAPVEENKVVDADVVEEAVEKTPEQEPAVE